MANESLNTEDYILDQVNALEALSEENLEFESKLKLASARARDQDELEPDDLKILIQSRDETPNGSRARQLAKHWKQVKDRPEVWQEEWTANKARATRTPTGAREALA